MCPVIQLCKRNQVSLFKMIKLKAFKTYSNKEFLLPRYLQTPIKCLNICTCNNHYTNCIIAATTVFCAKNASLHNKNKLSIPLHSPAFTMQCKIFNTFIRQTNERRSKRKKNFPCSCNSKNLKKFLGLLVSLHYYLIKLRRQNLQIWLPKSQQKFCPLPTSKDKVKSFLK